MDGINDSIDLSVVSISLSTSLLQTQEICKMGDEFRPVDAIRAAGMELLRYRSVGVIAILLLPIFIFAKQFPQMIEFFSIGDAGAGSCRLGR